MWQLVAMTEFETGIFNSGLVLNYLLHNRSNFTIYLEDGAKIAGTLLGWDADFLLIKEGKFLQMIRINKILRLQADLEQVIRMDSPVIQENFNQHSIETTRNNSSNNNTLTKFKPALTEVKTPAAERESENLETKSDFKDKLDHLVKNW